MKPAGRGSASTLLTHHDAMLAAILSMPAEKDHRGLTPSAERIRRLADELEASGELELAALVRRTADDTPSSGPDEGAHGPEPKG